MIKLTKKQLNAIKKAAIASCPNEMCGFLTKTDFVKCDNKAENPEKAFKISALDYAKYLDSIIAVVHTHVPPQREHISFDPRTPSIEDMNGQRATGLPWLIFACDGKNITAEPVQIPRLPNQNYLNRPFIWFINDCYSLVQDYYHFELGIDLPDHKAKSDYHDIRHLNCIFDEFIQEYGFKSYQQIDAWKNGDIVLLDNAGFKRNHLGIYHNGNILHQDMISLAQPASDFFGRINEILRYVG